MKIEIEVPDLPEGLEWVKATSSGTTPFMEFSVFHVQLQAKKKVKYYDWSKTHRKAIVHDGVRLTTLECAENPSALSNEWIPNAYGAYPFDTESVVVEAMLTNGKVESGTLRELSFTDRNIIAFRFKHLRHGCEFPPVKRA